MRRLALVVAAAAALALPGLAAPAAQAGCGGVRRGVPRHVHHHGLRVPLAIGDSSMLLALDALAREGIEGNAHGCREYPEGLALIRKRLRYGTLPHLVVIALGADASISSHEILETLRVMGPYRKLALVTPRELGGWSGHDARICRIAARRHPKRVILLDWVKYSSGHHGWFQPDGLHLTFSGAAAFARLLKRALPYAYPKRARHSRAP